MSKLFQSVFLNASKTISSSFPASTSWRDALMTLFSQRQWHDHFTIGRHVGGIANSDTFGSMVFYGADVCTLGTHTGYRNVLAKNKGRGKTVSFPSFQMPATRRR